VVCFGFAGLVILLLIQYRCLLLDLVDLDFMCICLLFVVLCWVATLLGCFYRRYGCILSLVVVCCVGGCTLFVFYVSLGRELCVAVVGLYC